MEGPLQRRGIATQEMQHLIAEAAQRHIKVRLKVVKIDPARRLYERLGFQITGEDDRKLYMDCDPEAAAGLSN